MLRKTILLKILILGVFTSSFIFALTKITEPKINQFVDKMVKEHSFDSADLKKLLLNTTYQEQVIAAIQKPAEKLPWYKYERIFLTDNRVNAGVKFWQENEETLNRATNTYGVPQEIIVSLIGVETFYGKIKGSYPVLDSLVSLSFYYPPRAKFFTSELEHFLLYAREENKDPRSFRGSYAGAMGYPQFISSSIRNFAVDFSNDGYRDLHDNVVDAIGSVGNFINKHGWINGEPIVLKTTFKGPVPEALMPLLNSIQQPTLTAPELKVYGITPPNKISDKLPASVFSFELDDKPTIEYWLGFNNFYTITRYNRSQNYALAVYLLSEKIKVAYAKTKQASNTTKATNTISKNTGKGKPNTKAKAKT